MSSWGANTSDESKPKYLTDEEKAEVYATERGWELKNSKLTGNNNPAADPEILVAIGGLSTSLGVAGETIGVDTNVVSSIALGTTSMAAAGGSFSVKVRLNEQVVVSAASPLMVLDNSQAGGGSAANFTLTMDGALPFTGSELSFSTTIPGAGEVAANDILAVAAQTINFNGATIVDNIGGGNVPTLKIIAAQGTAAGSVTVSA